MKNEVTKKPIIINITGDCGSGKTSFANMMLDRLPGKAFYVFEQGSVFDIKRTIEIKRTDWLIFDEPILSAEDQAELSNCTINIHMNGPEPFIYLGQYTL